MLFDAFGWRFFEQFADSHPLLQRMEQQGKVTKLTSQFPSTTAAHATAIHSGLPVGQSGVFEWQYYEPKLDDMIAPLLFSFAGSKRRDTLADSGIRPDELYPAQTFYNQLQQQGVHSFVFQSKGYTPSTYSDYLFRGAKVMPYSTLPETLVNMRLLVERQPGPAYFFLYYGDMDSICHEYGPQSPQVEAQNEAMLTALERFLVAKLEGKLADTLLVITADHGQVEVDPQTTVYLNLDPAFRGFERFMKTNRQGKILAPSGSARDFFLYIHDDLLEEAQAFLSARLEGKAEVWRVAQMLEEGYFGPPPFSPNLAARAGALVILPYAGESVWWYEKDRFEQDFYGHHGGLTRAEMEIPLCLYEL
ncbi:MAG: alkaline phosphatase family protein [Caldilineaceae bacterium]